MTFPTSTPSSTPIVLLRLAVVRVCVRVLVLNLLSLALVGCSTPSQTPVSGSPTYEPITVSTRDLRPTVSMDAVVVSSPLFSVLADATGTVSDLIGPGSTVGPGTMVARIDGAVVSSPVEGVVVGVLVDAGQAVPANLPLVAVRYAGFALEGTPTTWARSLLYQSGVTARAQITDGSGPFSCAAIVPFASPDEAAAVAAGSASVNWQCLLPKDIVATGGQVGVVVVVGTVATQVVAVPVSAVAGRQGTGQVTLLSEQGPEVVDVTLGRTDGSYIEIVEGLQVGDKISPVAPNLTTKTAR